MSLAFRPRSATTCRAPGNAVYTTILVMGGAILAAKLAHAAPDLLIRPNVTIFRTLDFPQATAILRAAEAVKAEVKDKLGALLA